MTKPAPENEVPFTFGPATLRVWDAQGRQRVPRIDADTLDGKHAADFDHNILSATHLDSAPASAVRGDLLAANAAAKWARVPKGTVGQVFMMGVDDPGWAAAGVPGVHDILGASHMIAGGAALDLVGQSGVGVIARVTPSAAPGVASAVLKTDATGLLTLDKLDVDSYITMANDSWIGRSATNAIEFDITGNIFVYLAATDALFVYGAEWVEEDLTVGGAVGIGIAIPETILHARVVNATAVLRLERDDTTIGTNDIVGRLEVEGQDAGAAGICAKLEAIAEGNNGETGWRFSCGIAGAPAEVVRMDYLGNVGIGVTEPDAKLHINSATGAVQRFTRDDVAVVDDDIIGRLEFETRDATAAGVAAYIQAEAEGASGETGLAFATGTSATMAERMRIGSAGDVSMVGHLTVGTGLLERDILIDGAAGQVRDLRYLSGSSLRWVLRTNATAEGGANAGSNFQVLCRDDAGNALYTPIHVVRATGNTCLGTTTDGMTAGGSLAIAQDLAHRGSNVGFFNVAPSARSTGWAVANLTADKVYDADATSTAELADVLGTLITALITKGLIGA